MHSTQARHTPLRLTAAVGAILVTLLNTNPAGAGTRSEAMGGVGVALPGELTATGNPALLALGLGRADILLDLPDVGRRLPRAPSLGRELDAFQNAATAYEAFQDADTLSAVQDARHALGGKPEVSARRVDILAALPQLPVSIATWFHLEETTARYTEAGSSPVYGPTPDYQLLLRQQGLIRLQAGAILARVFRSTTGGSQRLAFGIMPKLLALQVETASANARDTDPSQLVMQTTNHSSFDLDVGMVKEFAWNWKFGLKITDLLGGRFGGNGSQLGPELASGVSLRTPRGIWALDAGWRARPQPLLMSARGFVATGGEIRLNGWAFLRGGTRITLDRFGESYASTGLGFRWSLLVLDIGFTYSVEHTVGVSAHVGVRL